MPQEILLSIEVSNRFFEGNDLDSIDAPSCVKAMRTTLRDFLI